MPHRESFLKPLFLKKLDLVILFVTSICNARCRTCFYWLELNRKGDLTFEELDRLSNTMPEFHDLWLSGGEPFLRRDLSKVIQLFYEKNQIREVRIPTNGLPTSQITTTIRYLLDTCPNLHLEVDISLDGFAETHDRIRGVPGNFDTACETMQRLEELRSSNPNLSLYINSVITEENQEEIIKLGHHFQQHVNLDGHYFQIIRGEPKDPKLRNVSADKLIQIYSQASRINFNYIGEQVEKKSFRDTVRQAYWKAGYAFSYQTQYGNYVHGTPWRMPCTAGRTSIVIDYNGDVRVCELRKPIGNLRKHGMDFSKFWESWERKREVQRVKSDRCFCTHICFMYDSMRHSKRVMLWELPKVYAEFRLRDVLRSLKRAAST